jgi:hypothetical protein
MTTATIQCPYHDRLPSRFSTNGFFTYRLRFHLCGLTYTSVAAIANQKPSATFAAAHFQYFHIDDDLRHRETEEKHRIEWSGGC